MEDKRKQDKTEIERRCMIWLEYDSQLRCYHEYNIDEI